MTGEQQNWIRHQSGDTITPGEDYWRTLEMERRRQATESSWPKKEIVTIEQSVLDDPTARTKVTRAGNTLLRSVVEPVIEEVPKEEN